MDNFRKKENVIQMDKNPNKFEKNGQFEKNRRFEIFF